MTTTDGVVKVPFSTVAGADDVRRALTDTLVKMEDALIYLRYDLRVMETPEQSFFRLMSEFLALRAYAADMDAGRIVAMAEVRA